MTWLKREGRNNVPFDKQYLQTSIHHVRYQRTIISAYRFETFTIHFVMFIGFRKIQASITFLVDQEIRKIHFLKLQFYGLDEFRRHVIGRFFTECHCIFYRFHAKFNHHGIGVAIYDYCIVFISIFYSIAILHFLLCSFYHSTSISGNALQSYLL